MPEDRTRSCQFFEKISLLKCGRLEREEVHVNDDDAKRTTTTTTTTTTRTTELVISDLVTRNEPSNGFANTSRDLLLVSLLAFDAANREGIEIQCENDQDVDGIKSEGFDGVE
ncbi:hypothetical protein HZH66_011778 [Vespula vulgaris]|uniref:Uncharacterized protein n=1 Tax=Vespula vulgaris TaxID=7454 RepID=A0A834JI68_VESVU|nr:hypothetical protein HZH66_011778 [Vespula vulgaris]